MWYSDRCFSLFFFFSGRQCNLAGSISRIWAPYVQGYLSPPFPLCICNETSGSDLPTFAERSRLLTYSLSSFCYQAARQVCTPTRILHFFKLCERIFEGLLLLAMIAVQICVAYHNVGNWYEADPPPGQFPT